MRSRAEERARERDLAWAEAFAGISRVAGNLSTRLVQLHAEAPSEAAGSSSRTDAAPHQQPREHVPRVARLPRGGYGPRQQAVLALRGLDQPLGMTTAEVANATAISTTNAHTVLGGLAKLGALERIPDERPTRWRRALA